MLKDKFIQEEIWRLKNKDRPKLKEKSVPPNLMDGPIDQRNLKDEKIFKLASGAALDELVEAQQFMKELFDRLSLWLPISIGIKNLGVSLALDYGGIPDHVKARNGLHRLLEEAECLDRFNVVNQGRVMYILPPVSLKSAVLLAQLQERFRFESFVVFGLNLLDDLLSSVSMDSRYAQTDISDQKIELMAFDPSISILRTVTNAISDIRLP